MSDPFYGVCGFEQPETDFQVGGELVIPKARKSFADGKIQYNQNEVHKFSCTIHGAIGALGDNAGYYYTLDQRKKLLELALGQGFNPTLGWYVHKAVNLVRHYWNDKMSLDYVSTYAVALCSEEFYDALEKGYSIVVAFRGNKSYQQDAHDNGILESVNFGVSTFGHCLRMTKGDDPKYLELVVDNYVGGSKNNTYKIAKENLVKLVDKGVFVKTGYIFCFVNDMNNLLLVPPWATSAIAAAEKKGIKFDYNKLNFAISDSAEEEDIYLKIGALTVKMGYITQARRVVALWRKGLLN